MKQYIKLYENWNRPETITLSSPTNGNIVLNIEHGAIRSIQNDTQFKPNFTVGQPAQLPFIKGWASTNFTVYVENEHDEITRNTGITSKYISKNNPLKLDYPSQF
jgi:hypothetical protein